MLIKEAFLHHVYFWLNNKGNEADRNALIAGLQKLSKPKIISTFHIGVPADTTRDVVERSYDVSWLLVFSSAAEQEAYQTDPDHLLFVKECAHLWQRVVVYDSIAAV